MNPLEDKEALKRHRAYKRLFMKILNESKQDGEIVEPHTFLNS